MSELSSLPEFQRTQYQFAAHLRDPENCSPPLATKDRPIEDRRLGIYRELVFNNIYNFTNGGFPVLSSILGTDRLRALIRQFVIDYRCHSPYFLEISQEFLRFLQEVYQPAVDDPAFLQELAHYEWVELALDVAEAELPPEEQSAADWPAKRLSSCRFHVSPLAWSLSYTYPVHRISENFQPEEPPEQASFLVVHRNRKEQVGFLEINAVTARLLQLLRSAELSGEGALRLIATELGHSDPGNTLNFGAEILSRLCAEEIIFPVKV